jgi:hypothetical protein
MPEPGQSVEFDFSENIKGFYNPMQNLAWGEAQAQIDSDVDLASFFKQDRRLP